MDAKTCEDLKMDFIQPITKLLDGASALCNSASSEKRDIQNMISLADSRMDELVHFITNYMELKNDE